LKDHKASYGNVLLTALKLCNCTTQSTPDHKPWTKFM